MFIDTGKEHSFFDEPEEKMIGVIVYGDPIGRLTGQSISDEIKRTEVLELTRLFIHDGMEVILNLGLYPNPLIGYGKTNQKSKP